MQAAQGRGPTTRACRAPPTCGAGPPPGTAPAPARWRSPAAPSPPPGCCSPPSSPPPETPAGQQGHGHTHSPASRHSSSRSGHQQRLSVHAARPLAGPAFPGALTPTSDPSQATHLPEPAVPNLLQVQQAVPAQLRGLEQLHCNGDRGSGVRPSHLHVLTSLSWLPQHQKGGQAGPQDRGTGGSCHPAGVSRQ